ncbi:protease inhibitor I42 family protein [Streptomyces sp. NPDC058955]|uniref:protease inhibitor I42 family protein n=1 Tax=unclassified Streptomyces TaxID=2593676 RepID=UPI0036527076
MAEHTVDHTADGTTLTLRPVDELVVTLPVNPLTGALWRVASYDRDSVVLVAESIDEVEPGAMGAGGTLSRFRFRAVAPARCELVIELRRGSEPAEEVPTYRLRLDITEGVRA